MSSRSISKQSRLGKKSSRAKADNLASKLKNCRCTICLSRDPAGMLLNPRQYDEHRTRMHLAAMSRAASSALSQQILAQGATGALQSPHGADSIDQDGCEGSLDGPLDMDVDLAPPTLSFRYPPVTVEEVPDEESNMLNPNTPSEAPWLGGLPLPFDATAEIHRDGQDDSPFPDSRPSTPSAEQIQITGDTPLQQPHQLPVMIDAAQGAVSPDAHRPVLNVDFPPALPVVIPPVPQDAHRPAHAQQPGDMSLPRQPSYQFPAPPAPPPISKQQPLEAAYQSSHELWYIRSFFALVAVLRARYKVPLVALSLLLVTVHAVFSALGLLSPSADRPNMHKFKQARTVLGRLHMDDTFTIYPVCPNCHHVASPAARDDTLCPECNTALFAHSSKFAQLRGAKKVPVRQWAYTPLSHLLSSLLSDDAIQDKIEAQSRITRQPGVYHDTLDGKIMRELRDRQGGLFFSPRDDGELRIGVTLAGDGFDPFSHSFHDSHSTTALSFAIANLDFTDRYKYLLLPTLIPGPKEPTCPQLQKYMRLLVDDLIKLYEDGILVYSKRYPEGRRVRVALVLVICDHPAMCRLCGFADKGHLMAPCTKCKITQAEIRSPAGLLNEFQPRDGAEHKRRALEWFELPAGPQRDAHYAQHGSQWFELARLSYFDPVRMSVVGPMHCLLNGVMKNLWYDVWIKGTRALRPNTEAGTTRELDLVHKMLKEFEAPTWLGRLPKLVGEPAGGSLSADEWMNVGLTTGPIMLPPVWYETQEDADAEHAHALERYAKAAKAHEAAKKKFIEKQNAAAAAQPIPDAESAPSTTAPAPLASDPLEAWLVKHPVPRRPAGVRRSAEEMPMFLSLSAALQLILSRSLTDADVERGSSLLREHLRQFSEVYAGDYIKYNQHWSTHVPPQIPDAGPVYGCWEFPGERINKTLKGINTNGHRGGEMEVTMLREYQRTASLQMILSLAERGAINGTEKSVLRALTADTGTARGTVATVLSEGRMAETPELQPLASEQPDNDSIDFGDIVQQIAIPRTTAPISLPPAGQALRLDKRQQAALLRFYNADGLKTHFSFDSRSHGTGSIPLQPHANQYGYMMRDGRRVVPMDATGGVISSSGLVKIRRSPQDVNRQPCHGELLSIFAHSRQGYTRVLAYVRTFKDYAPGLMHRDYCRWDDYPEVEVEYWHANQFSEYKIVSLLDIICHLARVHFDPENGPPIWMTVALRKHRV